MFQETEGKKYLSSHILNLKRILIPTNNDDEFSTRTSIKHN